MVPTSCFLEIELNWHFSYGKGIKPKQLNFRKAARKIVYSKKKLWDAFVKLREYVRRGMRMGYLPQIGLIHQPHLICWKLQPNFISKIQQSYLKRQIQPPFPWECDKRRTWLESIRTTQVCLPNFLGLSGSDNPGRKWPLTRRSAPSLIAREKWLTHTYMDHDITISPSTPWTRSNYLDFLSPHRPSSDALLPLNPWSLHFRIKRSSSTCLW